MRPENTERLKGLYDRMAETFLQQCDPENWTASDVPPKKMSKGQKNGAHADVRYANQVAAVFIRIQQLHNQFTGTDAPPLLDKEIDAAERQAAELLARINQGRQRA